MKELKPKKAFIQKHLNIDRLTSNQRDGILRIMDEYAEHYHDYMQSHPDIAEHCNYPLFEYVAKYGGKIIRTNDLPAELIAQARASNRMYVDENSLGYVWEPPFAGRFPETVEEVKMFEWCYPLPVEVPNDLDERIMKKIRKEKK